ncbi:hypothetical protein G6F35_016128 [Rhizopus arrhizus]|nr:hypothetical protein G6F35_016128 [Rhizopus arrhizus]
MAAMGPDELIDDVQAQAQALALVEAGLERLEQARQQRVIDVAGVADPHHHRARIASIQLHEGLAAMGQRVAHQVGGDLPQPIHVTLQAGIADGVETDALMTVRAARFCNHRMGDFGQVAGAGLQPQAATADPREIQQLLDHPRHAQRAGLQVLQRLLCTGVVLGKLQCQLVGTQQDGRQRP